MSFLVTLSALALALLPPLALAACTAAPCAAGAYCTSASTCAVCPLGHACAGGATAQPAPCTPFSACADTGLAAQPPCAWSVVTYVGTGAAGNLDSWWTSATLSAPEGVATWPNVLNGQVIIAGGNQVRNATGSRVYALAGSPTGASGNSVGVAGSLALLNNPTRMALASGTPLYVSDSGNHAIRSSACEWDCVCVWIVRARLRENERGGPVTIVTRSLRSL